MQVTSSSTLTILHDGQFWIAVCEHAEGERYGARRFVLGASEPLDDEVIQFVHDRWSSIEFSLRESNEHDPVKPKHSNPKRQQRLVHRVLKQTGVGTKAQQAIQAQYEAVKEQRKKTSRHMIREEKERRFLEKQEKKKRKHRGH